MHVFESYRRTIRLILTTYLYVVVAHSFDVAWRSICAWTHTLRQTEIHTHTYCLVAGRKELLINGVNTSGPCPHGKFNFSLTRIRTVSKTCENGPRVLKVQTQKSWALRNRMQILQDNDNGHDGNDGIVVVPPTALHSTYYHQVIASTSKS